MKMYCGICKKNNATKTSSVRRTKENRHIFKLSNCVVCGKKKSRFSKNKEASRLDFR